MLLIYYLDDYLYDVSSEAGKDPMDYRLEEKFTSSVEIGDDLISVASELVKMSRSSQWHSRGGRTGNSRRPIRAGDVIVLDGKNYMYTLNSGWDLPGCRLKLKPVEKGIL